MSYIRAGFTGTYEAVDMEETQDYVFPFSSREPVGDEKETDTWLVEDYGSISNFGLVEIFYRRYVRNSEGEDRVLGLYMLNRLAQKLHVPLKSEFIVEAYRNSQTI